MKRLRIERWSSTQLLGSRAGASTSTSAPFRSLKVETVQACNPRLQSTAATPQKSQNEPAYDDGTDHTRFPPLERFTETTMNYPSPLPERALRSAKLSALHSRLALSPRLPLQTLARALVDSSADPSSQFNNTNLAFLGQTLINYHVSELLMCRYPRLPMAILYEAMHAYAGAPSLHSVARSWGLEHAAVPGGEVDPGLLQFDVQKDGHAVRQFGYTRYEAEHLEKHNWRRGINSRVVFDDDFGNVITRRKGREGENEEEDASQKISRTSYGTSETREKAENAFANAARAVVGAIYAHSGRDAAKSFIKAHILTRQVDLSKLFAFKQPTRELSLLCAREEFDPPVARLLSETGRLSRTPVFVVGIFSGADKLGEAAGSSLDMARFKAAMNALKAWYLYSPGEHVRVPSDMLEEGAKPWEPPHIDIGEVVSR